MSQEPLLDQEENNEVHSIYEKKNFEQVLSEDKWIVDELFPAYTGLLGRERRPWCIQLIQLFQVFLALLTMVLYALFTWQPPSYVKHVCRDTRVFRQGSPYWIVHGNVVPLIILICVGCMVVRGWLARRLLRCKELHKIPLMKQTHTHDEKPGNFLRQVFFNESADVGWPAMALPFLAIASLRYSLGHVWDDTATTITKNSTFTTNSTTTTARDNLGPDGQSWIIGVSDALLCAVLGKRWDDNCDPDGQSWMLFLLPAAITIRTFAGGVDVYTNIILWSKNNATELVRKLKVKLIHLGDPSEIARETHQEFMEEEQKFRLAHSEDKEKKFWEDMSRQHLQLDEDLEKIWSINHAGSFTLLDMFMRLYAIITFIVFAVGLQDPMARGFACLAIIMVIYKTQDRLLQLAKVTKLCQGGGGNTESILRLASQFTNHPIMTPTSLNSHANFLKYVRVSQVGVTMPGVGLLTMRLIKTAAWNAVGVITIFLSFVKDAWDEPSPLVLEPGSALNCSAAFEECIQNLSANHTILRI